MNSLPLLPAVILPPESASPNWQIGPRWQVGDLVMLHKAGSQLFCTAPQQVGPHFGQSAFPSGIEGWSSSASSGGGFGWVGVFLPPLQVVVLTHLSLHLTHLCIIKADKKKYVLQVFFFLQRQNFFLTWFVLMPELIVLIHLSKSMIIILLSVQN